jgi:hypothetical protein
MNARLTQNSQNIMCHIHRIKDKSQMIISTDAGNIFDKIQFHFTIKAHKKPGTEGNFFNLI